MTSEQKLLLKIFGATDQEIADWVDKPHVFDPWNCDGCRYEAQSGYEEPDEKEIADKWRAEQ